MQLGVGIDRRARQRDRRGQPPPHRGNRTKRYKEKRQRRTKRNRFHPSGRGSSISRSPAVCQEQVRCNRQACMRREALPQRDKVVTLLDKIRNVRHGNPPKYPVSAALGTYLDGINASSAPAGRHREQSGNLCVDGCFKLRNAVLRHLAVRRACTPDRYRRRRSPRAAIRKPRTSPASRRPPARPTPPRTTSARPTNSPKRRRPSTARPETPNASGSAAASCA